MGDTGAAGGPAEGEAGGAAATRGRLLARPTPPGVEAIAGAPPLSPGLHPVGPGRRGGLLRVPPAEAVTAPLPLVVMLHGAGGDANGAWRLIEAAMEEDTPALVLLPESRGASWDIIRGGFGPDVARLDAALAELFAAWPVDPARIAIAGFSDGASYALTLALGNGDLFTHALAFSPGFAATRSFVGQPRIYVSHGIEDEVLPIDACSRRLVPRLRAMGLDVTYREFEGGHWVPEPLAREALGLLGAAAPHG